MLLQERGWQAIQSVLHNPDVDPILAGPALTEVVTVARRKGNQSTGKQIWGMLGALGVRVEHTTDDDLLRAATLTEISQANPGPNNETLSLGDALILSVGERLGCLVITRDTYWGWLVSNNLIAIKIYLP